jgi:hypothetical protein
MTFFYIIESVTTDLNVMEWPCIMGRAGQVRKDIGGGVCYLSFCLLRVFGVVFLKTSFFFFFFFWGCCLSFFLIFFMVPSLRPPLV